MQKSVYTGLTTAITAYFIWGLSPIYWKSLAAVPAFEILMHRMIWSFVFLFPLIFFTGRKAALNAAVQSPKVMLILLSTTLLVGFNWFFGADDFELSACWTIVYWPVDNESGY